MKGSFGAVVCLAGLFFQAVAPAEEALDPQFAPIIYRSGADIYASALQPDGMIIVGGDFVELGGVPRTGIARLHSDGRIDTSFGATLKISGGVVLDLALQVDGKIVIAGSFTQINGKTAMRVARLNADGSVDATFDSSVGPSSQVNAVALDGNGKVLIAGRFTRVGSSEIVGIARLNSNGSLDDTFAIGAGVDNTVAFSSKYVSDVLVLSNQQILIAGYFNTVNGVSRTGLARLNGDGSLDQSFSNPSWLRINSLSTFSLVEDSSGRVLMGGNFSVTGSLSSKNIARLTSSGVLDLSFSVGTGPDFNIYAIQPLPDGKVLIGGNFNTFNGSARVALARLESNGSLDPTFEASFSDSATIVYTIALASDGEYLIGRNNTSSTALSKLRTNGSAESGFASSAGNRIGFIYAIKPMAGGRIYIGGDFRTVNGQPRVRIARLNSDGSLDSSFDAHAGPNREVYALEQQADGKIIIGGRFSTVDGTPRTNTARLDVDGSLDLTYNPGNRTRGIVRDVIVEPDQKIVVGGSDFMVTRLNSDGSADTSFHNPTDLGGVSAIALQPDGKIVVGGTFSRIQNESRNGLARLNSDGNLDSSFVPPTSGLPTVTDLVLHPDGTLWVAGFFYLYGSAGAWSEVIRVARDGLVQRGVGIVPTLQEQANAIALQPDGRLIVGLGGIQVGQPHAHKLARVTAEGQVEQNSLVNLVPADVTALAIDNAGNILVAGRFNSIAGQSRYGLARIGSQGHSETRISAPRVTPGGRLEFQIEAGANKTLKVQTSSDLQTWTEYTTVTTGTTTTLWSDFQPLSTRQQLFFRLAE